MIYEECVNDTGSHGIRICNDCGSGRNRCDHGKGCRADGCGGAGECGQQHCGINTKGLLDKINKAILLSKSSAINDKQSIDGGGFKMGNEEKKENQPEDIGRRKFIGGAGLLVGGAALLGAGALSGCSVSSDSVTAGQCTTTVTTTTVNNVEYLGECICPRCGTSVPHPKGVPCRLVPCPRCETVMGRSI
jgi:hypothetical protein